MLIVLALLLAAYALGSISGSLVLGRLRGVDIRARGSGNAGGTNAFRTMGWRFALGVVLIDIGKGALAVLLVRALAPADLPMPSEALALCAGAAAVCGHTWPVFFGFRGGKGAATLVGTLLVLWPWAMLPLIGVWLLSLTLTGWVGLSTMLAGLTLPLAAALWRPQPAWLLFGGAAALFLLFSHRENLRRLWAGTESRFEGARLWHRLWRRVRG